MRMQRTGLAVLMLGMVMFNILLFCGSQAKAESADGIIVTINGSPLNMAVPPAVIEGHTLVPLRAIFEALGAQVQWNDADHTIMATKDNTTITLTIGSTTAIKNGTAVMMDIAPQIIGDHTLVPARFVSTALGAQVAWDDINKVVSITTSGSSAIDNPALYQWNGVTIGMTQDQVKSAAGDPEKKCSAVVLFWNYPDNVTICFGDIVSVDGISLSKTNDSLISVGDPAEKLVNTYGQPTTTENVGQFGSLCDPTYILTDYIYTTPYGTLIFSVTPDAHVIQSICIGYDFVYKVY